jgi:hypothetical protein
LISFSSGPRIVRTCSQRSKSPFAELLDKLESVLGRVAFGPKSREKQVETELTFENWCLANGLKVPGAERNAYDRHREEEIAERQRQEKLVHDRQWGDSWSPF